MILGQDIVATTTSGTIQYMQPDLGPGLTSGVPGFFFAGTSWVFDALQLTIYRVFLAFDLSAIPQEAKLISCVLSLTGASDLNCPLLYVPFSWADPINTGTVAAHTKWQNAGNTGNKVPFKRSGDSGPNLDFSVNLLKLGYDRASLGQRFSCVAVRENDEFHDEQVMGDTWGIGIADLGTPDPLKRPRLSIAYEVPGEFLPPRGRARRLIKPTYLEKSPKINFNYKDKQLQ